MRPRKLFVLALSLLGASVLAGAPAASATPTVSLFSPKGFIEPGSTMYDFGEVRLEGKGLTGGHAACEELLDGTVLTNGRPVDTVAFFFSRTDEYCEGQIKLESLPRIEYTSTGLARLAGRFVANLSELGCSYLLTKLSAPFYSRHLQVTMNHGVAKLLHEEPVHGSCPASIGASFAIFGAFDSPQMLPSQADVRTALTKTRSGARRRR